MDEKKLLYLVLAVSVLSLVISLLVLYYVGGLQGMYPPVSGIR